MRSSCAFTQGRFVRTGTRRDAGFTAGKRYMAVKLVPLGSCYHHSTGMADATSSLPWG